MLKRAWFVFCMLWIVTILFIGFSDSSVPFDKKLFIIAGLPLLISRLVRFVVRGPALPPGR